MRSSSTYRFIRTPGGEAIIQRDNTVLQPEESLRLVNHSPDGFEWGYGGSGPSQAACGILLDFLGPGQSERVLRLYQPFKWQFVANMDIKKGGKIPGSAIAEWIHIEEHKSNE